MLDYLIRRVTGTIPVLLAVSAFVFLFVHLLPGDPARLVAGPDATQQDIAAVRADMGLDRPLIAQYARYLGQTAQFNLGRSIKTHQTVAELIGERFMPTLLLTVFAMLWSVIVGIGIGVLSGVKRGRWPDQVSMVFAISGVSFPGFWLGLLLIDLFSVRLGWLPTGGYGTWQNFVLPAFTLGTAVAAVMARFTRSAFVEITAEDYVRTARAKGVPERGVVWKHTLRNALIPVITLTGLQFGFLLGRRDRGGDGVRLAGPRAPAGRQCRLSRLPGDPGGDPAVLLRVRADQPDRRSALRRGEPGDPPAMSDIALAAPSLRSPSAEFWRRFRRKRVAVVSGCVILALILSAVAAPWIAPYGPATPDYDNVLAGPSWQHLCGTDTFGRDILSRILWGGRISLTVGFVSVALGGMVGVALGLISGFFGGVWDSLIMRLMDVLLAFPGILLAIGVVALLGPGIDNVIYAIAVFSLPVFARLVRGSTLALKHTLYVQAARSIGVRAPLLMLRHILPGTLPSVIVYCSLRVGTSILTAAALSFIGLGAPPPSPEWGAMLAEGRSYLGVADQITLFPGLAIFVTVLAFNLLGDGLRDALDQKLR